VPGAPSFEAWGVAQTRRRSNSGNAWIDQFESAFSEGRFGDAARLYEEHGSRADPPGLIILAARSQIHAQPTVALALLLAAPQSRFKGPEQVQRDILLAEAFARTRDFRESDFRLDAALTAAKQIGDADLVAAVAYRHVRRYLLAEDPAAAREFLPLTRRGRSRFTRLYALFAETLILPYEERVREQAERLIELLRQLDPEKNEFHEIRFWSTHALSVLAREMCLPDAIAEVDRQLGGLQWPRDFAPNLFQTHKALAWAKAIQGDYFSAFRHLKQASTIADTTAWKVVAACDRAYLARRFNEPRWSRVELDEAEQLAKDVEWHATLGEERTGLLLLAELFSDLDVSRSAMYLAKYRELGDIRSPLYYRNDARIQAFAKYSTGIVEVALGNPQRGVGELRGARSIFERFGYDFRSALCLVEESKVVNDDSLLIRAKERLHNYGQSWLAADLRQSGNSPSRVALPPMQQRVFHEICQGKSNADIARSFGRSEFTISNHIKQIFKAFGVGSRTALIAEAIRRGLVRTS
jgi:DNA-binding CsgD family transcriptional regulator